MDLSKTVELLQARALCSSVTDVKTFAFHVEVNKDILPLYISNVELFISLSIAAIVLSVAYREKVLGNNGAVEIGWPLIMAWFFLLSAIGVGSYYMFAAIKHMEARYDCGSYLTLGEPPGTIYSIVVVLFTLGIFSLFISVIRQTTKRA